MDNGYISEELKKLPATQYDIEKLSHKLDKLFMKVDNIKDNSICSVHSEKIEELDGRVTNIEKKVWMAAGGLAVLQIAVAVILALVVK